MIGFFKKILSQEPGVSTRTTLVDPEWLQEILFALEDGILVYDEKFRILFLNPAAERVFNLSKPDILGKEITPQDLGKTDRRIIVQVIFPSLAPVMVPRGEAGKYPQIVDLTFRDPALELRVVTVPVSGKDGGVAGFMKIIHDRTRELTLLRSKNEFITIASHQLRSPLTDINWALDTLLKDETLHEEERSIVKRALEAGIQLLSVTEDLLAIAKIEEGRFGYTYEPANLVEAVENVVASFLTRTRELGMKLYFDKPEGTLPPVMIDEKKMAIVLQNLLDNALRYNVPGGEVSVKIEALEGEPFLKVSVKDTGIGFSEDDGKNIFTKFFRGANAVKMATEGSGLGLYVTKNIIQAHGGKIWFQSESNRGSTFFFTLPTDPALIPRKEIPLDY